MEERLQLERVPLTSADALTEDLDYRHVHLTGGELVMEQTFVVERRFHKHQPGDWTVTPYRFADGSVVLVHTGWIPQGRPELATQPPRSLDGFVVTPQRIKEDALLRQDPDFALTGVPRIGELDLPALYAELGGKVPPRTHTFVVLNGPDEPLAYPTPSHEHITKPYLTPGVHFGYAVMWYGSGLLLIWLFWAGWTGRLDPRAR